MVLWPVVPPPVAATPQLLWVLRRAFAEDATVSPPLDNPQHAVELAETHDLAVRIAGRTPYEVLQAELGVAPARGLAVRRMAVESWEERLLTTAREVAGWLEECGIPVALLKFAALRRAGYVTAGTRPAGDLDLLVPKGEAPAARAALLAAGCREERIIDVPHHLPPLLTPAGVPVELHTAAPGVALPGEGRRAGFDELQRAGLLEPAASAERNVFLPRRELLAAHCLAHGLRQHGATPLAYPPMRMLADLVDLGFGTADDGAALEATLALVPEGLRREAAAAVALCRALRAGAAGQLLDEASAAARLLRHTLAGPTDAGYRDALRFWGAVSGGEGGIVGRLREARQALWLTSRQVELMHGPQTSAWGYRLWRLVRPWELSFRLCRYLWAAARHRWIHGRAARDR